MRNLTTPTILGRAVLSLAAAATLVSALPAAAAPASHAIPGAAVVTGEAAPWQNDRGRHRGWNRGDRGHDNRGHDNRGYDRDNYGGGYRNGNYNRYDRRDVYYGEPVYRNTRVWRGNDGRYYCRRENGTTGLLIGAVVGGMAGNELAGRRGDQTLGVIIGAAGGALLGRAIDRSNSRCR